MNKRLIVYILGWVLIVEGAAMQIATVTSFIYGCLLYTSPSPRDCS